MVKPGETLVETAVALLADGFCPIPIQPNGKKPMIEWKRFQEKAPTEAEVRAWFESSPDANLAIVTGRVSGVDVLDFDVGHDPHWPPEGCVLPTGCVIETPSGGLHYYFVHVEGARNSAGVLADKVDVRADGGYVLVPPSCINGHAYQICQGSLSEARQTPCPDWLREALLNGRARRRDGERESVVLSGEIPQGRRNATLTSLAGAMRRKGASDAGILAALRAENQQRCRPPLPEDEVAQIAASIARYPATEVGIFPCTDKGNSQRFVTLFSARVKHIPEQGWMVWDGRVWRPDADAAYRLALETTDSIAQEAELAADAKTRAALENWAKVSSGERHVAAILTMAKSQLGIVSQTEVFDADPDKLNCQNCILDLRLGEATPHCPEAYMTRLCGAHYDPQATAPQWAAFLDRIFQGNTELIDFVQRAVGYSLTGDTSERVFFLCYGTGANGKSTLLEVLRALLGDYAQAADFSAFLSKRTDGPRSELARMVGARMVTASESLEGRAFDEALLKQLTGGDTICVRKLYRDHFEFKPAFKLWLACNHKPRVREATDAIWDRTRLIPFSVRIPEADRDKYLVDKLKAELSGILNWALQGCLAWQRDEGLHPPPEVLLATQEYRDEQDVLGRFIEECCVQSPQASVQASVLYRAYSTWCTGNGEFAMTQTAFGIRLKEKGFSRCKRPGGHVFWTGIAPLS